MKKMMTLMMTLLVLSGCNAESNAQSNTPVPVKDGEPVRMVYDRMWEYGAHGESEDSEYINEVLELIRSFRTGEESEVCTEDFTDVITFYYADGMSERFEFEEYNLVENGKRYLVEGDLSGLRRLLERCLEDNE